VTLMLGKRSIANLKRQTELQVKNAGLTAERAHIHTQATTKHETVDETTLTRNEKRHTMHIVIFAVPFDY